MKIEILRGRAYRGTSLEVGRVYSVDANFAGWMVMRGFAKPYVEPEVVAAAEPAADAAKVKRGRPAR
jgi:endonuclease YncB( thermonuclease family)